MTISASKKKAKKAGKKHTNILGSRTFIFFVPEKQNRSNVAHP